MHLKNEERKNPKEYFECEHARGNPRLRLENKLGKMSNRLEKTNEEGEGEEVEKQGGARLHFTARRPT
jgi:hypothetical protein